MSIALDEFKERVFSAVDVPFFGYLGLVVRGDGKDMTSDPISFRTASEFTDPESLIPQVLPWVLDALHPYFDWLCGGADVARRAVETCMRQKSSELSIYRVDFLMCGSELAGGGIALSGPELKKARTSDMETLWALLDRPARAGLIERLSQRANLFAPVADDEHYGSKLGVLPAFRGRGLSEVIVRWHFQQAAALGFKKVRTDVNVENRSAIRHYLAAGFKIIYTGQSADGALKYHGMRYEQ